MNNNSLQLCLKKKREIKFKFLYLKYKSFYIFLNELLIV